MQDHALISLPAVKEMNTLQVGPYQQTAVWIYDALVWHNAY